MSTPKPHRAPLEWTLAPWTRLSSFFLVASLLATAIAKAHAVLELTHGRGFLAEWSSAVASDFVVYPLLLSLFAAGERVRPWVRYVTAVLSTLALGVAMINAGYLVISSDQVDARVLEIGFNRFEEVAGIALLQATRGAGRWSLGLVVLVPLVYLGARRGYARLDPEALRLDRTRLRVGLGLLVLGLLGVGGATLAGRPRTLGVSLLADNAIVRSYVTFVSTSLEDPEGTVEGAGAHFVATLTDEAGVRALAAHPELPSVLVVVLESTRFDHVELPFPGHRSAVRTPNLRALASRGVAFQQAHAVLPHTSKSLFSVLCGRLPSMENPIVEGADGLANGCLPQVFRGAGYATAFLQSAIGSFEQRPRLVDRLGYEHFDAYETLARQVPLGYLAADDRALPPAFERWLQGVPSGQRFFATILTSATHHPYELPEDVEAADPRKARSRYAEAVAVEDEVLGALLDVLDRTGRRSSTWVVALADHGEGLPGDPVQQHDNDFFETSLHVPLVISGPGVPPAQVRELVNLTDVAPTLLGMMGLRSRLPPDEFYFGVDTSHGRRRSRSPFTCWHESMCEGVFVDGRKLVRQPSDDRSLAVVRDEPGNPSARVATAAEERLLRENHERLLTTRVSGLPLRFPELRLASGFRCSGNAPACVHPSRPLGGFHPRD